ncbi:MAG TPA: CBS domain-containing protein [archaeon]|nr:CBS domain-containing protein [archaeon]
MAITAVDLLEKNFLRVEKDSSISQLIGKMISSKQGSALVFQGDSFLGLVSKRELARKKIVNASKIKVASVLEAAPVLSSDTEIEKIAELMFSSGARVLPVSKNNEIIGIVSALSVVNQINSFPEIKKIPVKLVWKKPFVLEENSTVAQALSMMREKNISGIPVVDNESFLKGFISIEDIMEKFFLFPKERDQGSRSGTTTKSTGFSAEKVPIAKTPVKNEMTESVITIEPHENLLKAAKLMFSNNIHHVVVEENSQVLGIVSIRDILSCFAKKESARNIQIANFPQVDEIDRAKIMGSIFIFYDKIAMVFPGEFLLHVHFKEHGKLGTRKKHTVHLKLVLAGKTVVASAFDWKLLTAVQSAIESLEREARDKIKRT